VRALSQVVLEREGEPEMLGGLLCILFGHVKWRDEEPALLRLRKRVQDATSLSIGPMGEVRTITTKAFRVVDIFRCKRCHGLYWTEWEDRG